MLLFGHRFIQSDSFYHILDSDAIIKTPPSSTLYIEFNEASLDTITYLRENQLNFALSVNTITEIIYASALDASFIVVTKELVKTAQSIAESYLFDAKILVHVTEEKELEELALLGIDGALFSSAIIKINS